MNQGALDPNGSVESYRDGGRDGRNTTVAHVCAGIKKIQASAAGYATTDRRPLQVEQGKPLAGIDFALNEGGGISGPGRRQATARRSSALSSWRARSASGRRSAGPAAAGRPGDRERAARRRSRGRDAARESRARIRHAAEGGGRGEEAARPGRTKPAAKLANLSRPRSARRRRRRSRRRRWSARRRHEGRR